MHFTELRPTAPFQYRQRDREADRQIDRDKVLLTPTQSCCYKSGSSVLVTE